MLPAERRTVIAGIAVSAIALLLAYGVVPYARRWSEREVLISARAGQLERMRQAIADSAATRMRLARAESEVERWPARVIVAPSRDVAESVLQADLRVRADRAGVQLTRLDGGAESAGAADIAAMIVVVADAPALAALLAGVHEGPYATSIQALDLRVNPVLRGPSPLMNVTIGVSAPWRRE